MSIRSQVRSRPREYTKKGGKSSNRKVWSRSDGRFDDILLYTARAVIKRNLIVPKLNAAVLHVILQPLICARIDESWVFFFFGKI